MDPFHEGLARRVVQFEWWLRRMQDRRRGIGDENCFVVFSDDESSSSTQRRLKRAKSRTRSRAKPLSAAFDFRNYRRGSDQEDESESNANDESDGSGRFIQFAFCDKHFYMDEPNSTLFPAEAARLFQDRSGFYFACARIASLPPEGYEATFDPVFKQYVNGDEISAAEDMAYIFFKLWNCPVDMPIYIRASDFEGKHSWEDSFPTK